jgi:hypothetical protein
MKKLMIALGMTLAVMPSAHASPKTEPDRVSNSGCHRIFALEGGKLVDLGCRREPSRDLLRMIEKLKPPRMPNFDLGETGPAYRFDGKAIHLPNVHDGFGPVPFSNGATR